jgi:DNA repair exonuclease SbcCD ATPase subunit
MKISFEKIKLKNFLSFGNNETEFEYKTGIHAITGNQMPNNTIRNGVGKSSLLVDSIVFAIYGRTLRKLVKEEIVNTINEKDCVVECEMTIDKVKYRIQRGVKPTFLKIWVGDNTEPEERASMSLTQAWFLDIIKISFECFTNMIILNINHSKPFLEMDPKEKRPVLEDILQLNIYGKMNELAKSNHLTAKTDIAHLETAYKNKLDNFTKTKTRKESIDKEISKFEESKNKKINELKLEISEMVNQRDNHVNMIQNLDFTESLKEQNSKLKNIIESINENEKEVRVLIKEIERNNEVIDNLSGKPHCPLCSTPTNNPNVVVFINELQEKTKEITSKKEDIKSKVESLRNSETETEERIQKINSNVEKLTRVKNRISSLDNSIRMKNEMLTHEQSRSMSLEDVISNEDFIQLEADLKDCEVKYELSQKSFKYNKFIRNILGDEGVRKYITLKIIPFLNKTVNKYLSVLGSDYTIVFDSELNEKLIARNRDERPYSSFSGGEKRRIDLALLLALMDVSKTQNSIDTNILILDEVLDTSLDNEGAESFIEHLKGSFRTAYPDKCIYIITHRKDAVGDDSFDSIIHLVKQHGFTTIDKIV